MGVTTSSYTGSSFYLTKSPWRRDRSRPLRKEISLQFFSFSAENCVITCRPIICWKSLLETVFSKDLLRVWRIDFLRFSEGFKPLPYYKNPRYPNWQCSSSFLEKPTSNVHRGLMKKELSIRKVLVFNSSSIVFFFAGFPSCVARMKNCFEDFAA